MSDHNTVKMHKHGPKRQKLDPYYSELAGQLTARSHILHSQPASILIEICTTNTVEYIINEQRQTFMHSNSLFVGRFYKFLDLASDKIQLKTAIIKCYRFTKNTSWEEIESLAHVFHPLSLKDFKNISGKVTQVDDDFGICYINDSVKVLVSPCSRIALHIMPKAGQKIVIFNAHRINLQDGKVLYALCAKSLISIEGDGGTEGPFLNLSPLLQSLGDVLRDFRLILWLQDCLSSLQRSLSDDFLKLEGIPLQLCNEFRFTVLKSLAKSALNRISPSKISLLEEFVAADHKSCCGTLKERMIPYPLLSLHEANDENPDLENELDERGYPMYWQYDVNKDQKRFLVGLISMRNSTQRLCISDAFCSFYCTILPAEGQISMAEAMVNLHKSVVIAWDHDIIREKFSTAASQVTSHTYKCIAMYTDKTKNFNITSGNEINVYKYDIERKKFCVTPNRSLRPKLPVTSPNTLAEASKVLPAQSRRVCLTMLKGPPLQHYFSQYIMVQIKSSIIAPTFPPELKKPTRSYILVSLVGKMISSKSPIHRGHDTSSAIFLSLEKSLLQVHPLLAINTVYDLRLPVEFNGLLKKGAPLKLVEGLKSMLPTINCATLPDSCEIHTVHDFLIPAGSLAYRDFYGVEQALKEANPKELIDVVGYITNRYHNDPKFDREKVPSKVNGFGIPGCKVIGLTLRDTPPKSQTGAPATLYLSHLPTVQYPIGLVSGAKVVFRCLMKSLPTAGAKTTSPYFRSSILTSVEILELVMSEVRDIDESKKDLWGPRRLLHCALSKEIVGCLWMSVSMTQLLRVALYAKCSSCKHAIVNAKCTFVGCSASKSTIFSQASFMLQEFGSQSAVIFFPNALVPKLFHGSDKYWNMVETLALARGQLIYNRSASEEAVSQLSLEDKVFRTLCRTNMVAQRHHLLCREFNSKSKYKSSDLHAFYAIDISPVSMLMASS